MQDFFYGAVELRFRHHTFLAVTETYIALAAVMIVLFSKIAEQLSAATDAIIGGIFDDGMDAFSELCLTLLVDGGHELDMFLVLAPLGVADIGCLLLWDEMKDVTLAETLQDHIYLMGP